LKLSEDRASVTDGVFVQRFTELKVWQRGHALVLVVYRMTVGFPIIERYGLVSQLRRAVLSVPTNIAEGSKRVGRQEYARFLNIVEASLAETEYLLMVSRDLGYITPAIAAAAFKDVAELARMLHGLREKVEAPK
jgi:four helix bundle protein